MELTRNFLLPASSELPEDGDNYYLILIDQYQAKSGDNLGLARDENGDVYFENSEAETRFAQSLEAFFHGRSIRTNLGIVMRPSLLYLYYGRFLQGGANCPEGSPVRQKIDLAGKFESVKAMLQDDLAEERDFSWDDISRELEGEDVDGLDLAETATGRVELLEHAVVLIEGIKTALLQNNITSSEMSVLQIVSKLLERNDTRLLGLKLINMLGIFDNGRLDVPPRFRELVEGIFAYPPNIFHSLIEIWDKPGGEALFFDLFHLLPRDEDVPPDPLLTRLIYASAEGPLTEAKSKVIEKTLILMKDPDSKDRAEQMIELLEKGEKFETIKSDSGLAESILSLLKNPENSNLFYEFYARIPSSKKENVDPLIKRLLAAAAASSAGAVRNQFIMKALQDSKDPEKRELVEKILELLEDPEEVQFMDAASSKEEYIDGFKKRKKGSGVSGSQKNGSPGTPPLPPAAPAPSDKTPPLGVKSAGGIALARIPLKKPCHYMLPAYASVPAVLQAGYVPWLVPITPQMFVPSAALMVL
jgi:hypothetical protein